MTIQELIDYCEKNKISLDTQIALRHKDDFLLMKKGVYLNQPYFGNCHNGMKWEEKNTPRDENGDIDYDNVPQVLILDTFRG